MPNAFDASVGTSTANSYVSVDDADTFFAGSRPAAASTWAAADQATKEQVLRAATGRLDGLDWVGRRLVPPPNPATPTDGQALAWPRWGVWADGWYVPMNAYPRGLVVATCELALSYLADPSTDPESPTGFEGLGTLKVGGLTVQTNAMTALAPGALPNAVRRALRGLTHLYAGPHVRRA